MSKRQTIDKAGRIVIPKSLRDNLQLQPGDTLELEGTTDRIVLKPLRAETPLRKERGIWVYRTGRPLPTSVYENALRQAREDRDRQILGNTF